MHNQEFMDLESVPEVDEDYLLALIKRDLSGLPDEDQREIMEIAGDLFTDEELKIMFTRDFTEEGGLP